MRLLAIGPRSKIVDNKFSGQSVMFDGFVDYYRSRNITVDVVDIWPRISSRAPGHRYVDYLLYVLELLFYLIQAVFTFRHYSLCYITTSLGQSGVMRDLVFVRLLSAFHAPIVSHQFGAENNGFQSAIDRVGEKKFKKLLLSFSRIIVEGEYMKSQFRNFPEIAEKIDVIPNGLPILGKNALQPKHYEEGKTFTVIYLSNFIYSKGWHDVLEALSILVKVHKANVKFIFAGRFMSSVDDPATGSLDIDYFNHYIKENELSDYVTYYQGLYGDEKDSMFLQANAFVLPSYYINEGLPVSIIEAMSYGCVPVVTNYRHIPMVVSEENGCFVGPQKPDQIANAISELMNNPSVYAEKSQKCIDDFKANSSFDIYMKRVDNVLNTVIND